MAEQPQGRNRRAPNESTLRMEIRALVRDATGDSVTWIGFDNQGYLTVQDGFEKSETHVVSRALSEYVCFKALLCVQFVDRAVRGTILILGSGEAYSLVLTDEHYTWVKPDEASVMELQNLGRW